jgi:hypothetical protein
MPTAWSWRRYALAGVAGGTAIALCSVLLVSAFAMLDRHSPAADLLGSRGLGDLAGVLALAAAVAVPVCAFSFGVWRRALQVKSEGRRRRFRMALLVNTSSWTILLILWLWVGAAVGEGGWPQLGLTLNLCLTIRDHFHLLLVIQNSLGLLALGAVSRFPQERVATWLIWSLRGQVLVAATVVAATFDLLSMGLVPWSADQFTSLMDSASFAIMSFLIVFPIVGTAILWWPRPEDMTGQQSPARDAATRAAHEDCRWN